MVEVTQEDKRVAEDCVQAWDETRNGFNPCGDQDAGAEIVARHRTTTLAAKDAEIAELRDMIATLGENAAKAAKEYSELIAAERAKVEKLREALTKHNLRAANGDEITVADELEQAAGTLEAFVAADKEAGLDGLRDCTDNDGAAYQSEWMSGLMDHATINARTLRKWAATLRATLAETQPCARRKWL